MALREKQLIVSGEDAESEEEDEGNHFDDDKSSSRMSRKGLEDNKIKTPTHHQQQQQIKVVTFGEASESDVEEFGSTVSLDSSVNSAEEPGALLKLDSEAAAIFGPILPQRRTPRLDPALVKKHRERNKSLRINITEKFLTPVIIQSAKKFEKLSQNLSNSQMQMQEALFQSRIATGNMLKLQKELENFLEEDYLKELKIQPTDEDMEHAEEDRNNIENDNSVEDLENNQNGLSSGSLLTAALTGGAHLI